MCARGDGIRGSKDLRAEIGKFPNSTNERKQMSNKTMKQRIAVVAVSALTAGLFSVVSTPSANAALNVAAGTSSPSAAAEVMNVATTASATGSAVITSGSEASVGLVNVSDIAGGLQPGTTQTAVLLKTGTLVVYSLISATDSATNNTVVYTVENGTIGGLTNGTGTNAARTTGVCSDVSSAANCVASITPNSGATSMTVRMYNAPLATYATDASPTVAEATAAAAAIPTLGTLKGQLIVTLADASSAGTVSTAKSGVYFVSTYSASNTATSDTAGLGSAAATSKQYGAIMIKDAFGTAVAAGGLLQISATNGALVALSDGVGTASTAFSSTLANGQGFAVSNPKNTPLSTTVTVTYNGTVIGTKTFGFWGEVSKITFGTPEIGKQGTTSGNEVKFYMYDAASNPIYFTYATVASTFTPSSGMITSAASDDSVTVATAPAIAADGTITTGKMNFACGSTTTKQNIQVQYVNNSGTVITSPLLPVVCAGAAVSFKLSYDKATYTPGEIAVATVSFFDKAGNAAHDNANEEPTAAAVVISTSGMKGTNAIVAPAAGDDTTGGKVSYNFVVDVTEGTFTNSVTASTVDTAATAAGVTATKAATATITVKSSSSTVTNAEVLKSIVALIASINKQIQALQKLILKR